MTLPSTGRKSHSVLIVVAILVTLSAILAGLFGFGVLRIPAPHYSGGIQSVTVDQNVVSAGYKGMQIVVDYIVSEQKENTCRMDVLFFYRTGDPIKSALPEYSDATDRLDIYSEFIPLENWSIFSNTLFVPYDAFDIAGGDSDMYFEITITNTAANTILVKSGKIPFELPR